MTKSAKGKTRDKYIVERDDFQKLFDVLAQKAYRLLGPVVRDGVVAYDDIRTVSDLPIGYVDEQERGSYRLKKTEDPRLFGYGVGPHSWKKYLYPSAVRLWQANRSNGHFDVYPETHEPTKLALIGVRACELAAIAIQDKVLMGGEYVDPNYQTQRENAFIVAINCGQASKTCFCASMNTGPKATSGFDLDLTEVLEPNHHYFVVEKGSEKGAEVLNAIPNRPAVDEEVQAAETIFAETVTQMGRSVDTSGIKDLLYDSYNSTHWESIASRCLTCGNCTMVCPTCFCTTVEDVTDLSGGTAERWRKWDSCFTMDFSYIVGGSIRSSAKSRYRQWMTHKFASWIDQFGTSGCVGCGRCITWCPVGIDITEEVHVIREESKAKPNSGTGRKKKYENA
jgi:Fe-S-cluster-containing hydrogenase component 2